MHGPYLVLHGLGSRDKLSLGELEGIEYQAEPLAPGEHGEPATFTVMVTMSLVATLAAYLLRKHRGRKFREEIWIYDDGKLKERRVVEIDENSVDPPEASIIRQIVGGATPAAPA